MWGKPQRWTYRCPACGWQKTTPPTGDVRLQGLTHFSACPECRSPALELHPKNLRDALGSRAPKSWRVFRRGK